MPNSIEREILEELIKSSTMPYGIVQRAKIILHKLQNDSTSYILKHLQVSWKTVQKWVTRWTNYEPEFRKQKDRTLLKNLIIKRLADAPRSGKPPKFTQEQIVKITSLACTLPESQGIPRSHWSTRSLALQAKKMEIVPKISHESVANFLRKADLKPHRSRYWLNSRARNSSDFDERVKEICNVYENAIAMHQKGINIISVDEKSGMQAIERANPNLPMKSGSPEKIEHEYIRHGTLCLIGNLNIATGQMIEPMISPTRKEKDFLKNIKNVIATDPQAQWIFILDQLNTHKSESLVKWIAGQLEYKDDLGKSGDKGRGILKSMDSRQKFLEDKNHRIRFLFTPKHCSWINQIEIWFSGVARNLLKRMNVTSTRKLKIKVLKYIEYYNSDAKPFKWTYKGKVLQM